MSVDINLAGLHSSILALSDRWVQAFCTTRILFQHFSNAQSIFFLQKVDEGQIFFSVEVKGIEFVLFDN